MLSDLLEATRDYSSMLRRISIFTFLVNLILTILIAKEIPAVATLLGSIPVSITIDGFSLPLGYIFTPALLTLIARWFRLHDRLSDLFRIRERFDTQYILRPMAKAVGVKIERPKLREKRRELMSRAFYKYASSKRPLIDRHNIDKALETWSWYWVVVEADFFIAIAAAIFFAFCKYRAFLVSISVILLTFIPLYLSWRRCVRIAAEEIDMILEAEERREAIKKVFEDAL